jgi:hypothetical protein
MCFLVTVYGRKKMGGKTDTLMYNNSFGKTEDVW